MKNLKWLETALPKKQTGYNHNYMSIYRDGDQLVATDGDRLHIQSAENCGIGYLDPTICGTFPNYKQVIPAYTEKETGSFLATSELIAYLKQVVTLNKFNFSNKADRINVCIIDFEIADVSFTLEGKTSESNWQLAGKFHLANCQIVKKKIMLNAQYLIDAIGDFVGMISFSINLDDSDKPLILKYEDKTAVIMPLKGNNYGTL
jgi:DNA polymerase III sliding clamp (beta) subunit (PCNA family)